METTRIYYFVCVPSPSAGGVSEDVLEEGKGGENG